MSRAGFRSRRAELAALRAELVETGATVPQIAAAIRQRFGDNPRLAFRHAHGFTQEDVANHWNKFWPSGRPLTNKQVSYWENWPAPGGRPPSIEDLNRLARIYRCSPADLVDDPNFVTPIGTVDIPPSGEKPDGTVLNVDRRTFVNLGVAFGAAMVADFGYGPVGRVVQPVDVVRLQRVVARLRRLDQAHGSVDLWPIAANRANSIGLFLEQCEYSDHVGAELVELAGRAYICAGWLATDAGKNDLAHSLYTEALSYADQAGNLEVRVHALLNLALHASILRRPRQMLRYITAAQRALPADPPGRIPSLILMRQGRALAMLGEQRKAAHAFGTAHEALERDNNPPASWLPWFAHAEIDALEADSAIDMGRASRGASMLEQSLATYEDCFTRNRCLYIVRLARARLQTGDVDGTAEATNAALDLLESEVASVRVGTELQALANHLRPHHGMPAIAEVLDRYQSTPYAATP